MYRINYGNGQVSETFQTLAAAMRALHSQEHTYAWVERYDAGTADDPGDWHPAGIGRWSLSR